MSVQDEVQDIQDSLEDMGVTRLVPIKLNPKALEAEPEGPTLLKKPKTSDLMGVEDEELAMEVGCLPCSPFTPHPSPLTPLSGQGGA